jgi:hypothetical protein
MFPILSVLLVALFHFAFFEVHFYCPFEAVGSFLTAEVFLAQQSSRIKNLLILKT